MGIAEIDPTIAAITATTHDTLTETRGLIASTMPVKLESSFSEALSQVTARFSYETRVEVDVEVTPVKLPREAEVVLLRRAQEGLANVRKHTQADHVDLTVRTGPDSVVLALTDNGIGLDPDQDMGRGFGLEGMSDRVAMAGGDLVLESCGAGQGTRLTVTMPLHPAVSPTSQRTGVPT